MDAFFSVNDLNTLSRPAMLHQWQFDCRLSCIPLKSSAVILSTLIRVQH